MGRKSTDSSREGERPHTNRETTKVNGCYHKDAATTANPTANPTAAATATATATATVTAVAAAVRFE
uniref:Uncharacterized protein n=1 Tax=Vespula pensylvanica TaxID=30213 RepID=A0A834NSE8_VESPE|nr:hypothetical protein H0235_011721 [Vespula pensylvanica]